MQKVFLPTLLLIAIVLSACSSAAPAAPTPTPDPLVLRGQEVFNARCATCHALVPDTVIIGPSLAGIATRAATRVEGQSAEEYRVLVHLHGRTPIPGTGEESGGAQP